MFEWLINRKSISPIAIKQVILKQSNNAKRLAHVKNRSDVAFSTRKLYRQKGTGRARRGSRGSPLLRKGGVAHGPRFHIHTSKLNKKMAAAVQMDVLRRLAVANRIIIDEIVLPQISTANAAMILKRNNIDVRLMRVMVIMDNNNSIIKKSFQNIPNVTINIVDNIQTVELFKTHRVIIMPAAVEALKSKHGEKNV
jgi:large subunit ribosomal protein L4